MSRENLEVVGVRTPVGVPSKTRPRTLDERFLVRFPPLVRFVAAGWSRLPPRSRLRRTIISRFLRQGHEAANRRDFTLVLLALDPTIEFRFHDSPATRFLPPDLLGVHHGHDGYVRIWEQGLEAWDYKIYCDEVIDLGDHLLTVGRQTGHGGTSGISIDLPLIQLFTLRRGLVIRQVAFSDPDEALEAVGLRE